MKPTMLQPPTRTALVAVGIALAAPVLASPAFAAGGDDTPGLTTSQEVRKEISQAVDAVGDYAAQERRQALSSARAAMERLDAELDRRQDALRENWNDMSASAREEARAAMRDLRQARNRLGERYGALEAGADSAWDELTEGFVQAYRDLSKHWSGS
jgi:hypothetical protein